MCFIHRMNVRNFYHQYGGSMQDAWVFIQEGSKVETEEREHNERIHNAKECNCIVLLRLKFQSRISVYA
jgi:hypothetical protein